MENRIDKSIVEINKRYQDLFYSPAVQKELKKEKYLEYIKEKNYKKILEDILFKAFIRIPSSLSGNVNWGHPKKENCINKKIVVYSCVVGKYDRIVEPIYMEPGVDYLMFTDLNLPKNSMWKKVDITKLDDYKLLSPAQMNRKIKMLPHKFLKEYDYSLYVDGLIELVGAVSPIVEQMGDIGFGVHYHNQRDCIYDEAIMIKYAKKANMNEVKKQLSRYKKDGFPAHYGLYENTILLRKHSDESVCELMEDWWDEYMKFPTRDQLSLPYLIWKTNFPKNRIYIMGNNINRNPRFNRGLKHEGNK
jgi:hypothetical protein